MMLILRVQHHFDDCLATELQTRHLERRPEATTPFFTLNAVSRLLDGTFRPFSQKKHSALLETQLSMHVR